MAQQGDQYPPTLTGDSWQCRPGLGRSTRISSALGARRPQGHISCPPTLLRGTLRPPSRISRAPWEVSLHPSLSLTHGGLDSPTASASNSEGAVATGPCESGRSQVPTDPTRVLVAAFPEEAWSQHSLSLAEHYHVGMRKIFEVLEPVLLFSWAPGTRESVEECLESIHFICILSRGANRLRDTWV